jgi:hypothetical protein
MILVLVLVAIIALYSYYLGTHNLANEPAQISLAARYGKLMEGLSDILTKKLGPPLLLVMIIVNTVFIIRSPGNDERSRMLKLFRWALLFSLIYILLLPLGGYREYRPTVIRRDTFMPVLFIMIFCFTISAVFLLDKMNGWPKRIYIASMTAFLMVFFFADLHIIHESRCERELLKELIQSEETVVLLDNHCTLMGWGLITDPKRTRVNSKMLRYWNVIDQEKYYYQLPR